MSKNNEKAYPLLSILFAVIFFIALLKASSHCEGGSVSSNQFDYDSGSFALVDGFYFYDISVDAAVWNGTSGQMLMTAIAHVSVNGRGGSVYISCSDDVEDFPMNAPIHKNVSGRNANATDWYWLVDTRNNTGSAFAYCCWKWR